MGFGKFIKKAFKSVEKPFRGTGVGESAKKKVGEAVVDTFGQKGGKIVGDIAGAVGMVMPIPSVNSVLHGVRSGVQKAIRDEDNKKMGEYVAGEERKEQAKVVANQEAVNELQSKSATTTRTDLTGMRGLLGDYNEKASGGLFSGLRKRKA